MIKKILCAAVLTACAAASHAQTATQWSFSWTGFDVRNAQGLADFDPTVSVAGTFAGIDANHDNLILGSELTEFTVMGRDLLHCASIPGVNCGFQWFSYGKDTGLNFLGWYEEFDGNPWSGPRTRTQLLLEPYTYIGYDDYSNRNNDYLYWFTPKTIQTITQITPVPEPQAFAMLGAGVLLLGAAARRRNAR